MIEIDVPDTNYRSFNIPIGGGDTAKVVSLRIRGLTDEERTSLSDRHLRANRKIRSLHNQTAVSFSRQLEALAIEKACLALDGANDDIVLGNVPSTLRVVLEGDGVQFEDGKAALPRVWSNAIKRHVFTIFPGLVLRVNKKTDWITDGQDEDEVEDVQSFR